MRAQGDAPGLCPSCRWSRLIASAKGSRFLMCTLSATDARFAKYPRLPVLACAGYKSVEERKSGTER